MKLALIGGLLLTSTLAAPAAGLAAVSVTADSTPTPCPSGDVICADATGSQQVAAAPADAPAEVRDAVRTSAALVGARSGWYHKCDKLACRMYGYANSGYATANVHWFRMLATGHAHPGNRCPPIGSFVFWATGGSAGHVAFVAAGSTSCDPQQIKVVTNDWGDRATGAFGGIYQTTLAGIENGWMSRSGYRGWTDPVCAGARS